MTPAIVIDHLSLAFGETTILDDICLEIPRGEFVGVIGPNGGGKTTLLKVIMGFLTPNRGSVLINGQPPCQRREKIAYVPQTLRFDKFFPLSVEELVLTGLLANLPWWGVYRKKDREKAIAEIDRLRLSDYRTKPVGSLSVGQLQRALIARALVSEPEFLLLDEPTASVDADSEQLIYEILDHLPDAVTILMVTHDLDAIINRVEKVICVQREAKLLDRSQVCGHFTVGLYHKPLIQMGNEKNV